jgi:hypothetical protein
MELPFDGGRPDNITWLKTIVFTNSQMYIAIWENNANQCNDTVNLIY